MDLVVTGRGEELARALAGVVGGSYVLLDPEHDVSRVVINNHTGFCQFDITGLGDRDLAADLRRRDFTINAMALSLGDWLPYCSRTDFFRAPVFLNTHRNPAGSSGSLPGPAGAAASAVLQAGLKDPLGGLGDLHRGIIRACSSRSIEDDPVRALRAARLAAQLGFRIEPRTVELIRTMSAPLSRVAPERILEELVHILLLSAAWKIIDLLDRELGILERIFPEINPMRHMEQNGHYVGNVWVHSLKTLRCFEAIVYLLNPAPGGAMKDSLSGSGIGDVLQLALPGRLAGPVQDYLQTPVTRTRSRLPVLKLACLFHDIGKLETRAVGAGGRLTFYGHHTAGALLAAATGRRLRLSSREVDLLSRLVRGHMDPLFLYKSRPAGGRAVYRFFRRLGNETPGYLLLSLADIASSRLSAGALQEVREYRQFIAGLLQRYFEEPVLSGRSRPLLNGRDICSLLNIKPSPLVGRLLEELAAALAAGEVRGRQEAEEFIRTRGSQLLAGEKRDKKK